MRGNGSGKSAGNGEGEAYAATMQPPPVCLWLKRDLRVTDHAALAAAVDRGRDGGVVAVFIYEPEVLGQPEWSGDHSDFRCGERPASRCS
jgi:hypothetical protein